MSEHYILVVEDQEDLAELYETTLKQAGYRVHVASTGEEGIAEFEANGAEVILMDMTLPEMNGAQALHRIRAVSATVPVIVVTGETHKELREECERLGVQDYLAKPVNYAALLAAIERALESPPEEAEMITLRLPKRVLGKLSGIDSNIERAITELVDKSHEP